MVHGHVVHGHLAFNKLVSCLPSQGTSLIATVRIPTLNNKTNCYVYINILVRDEGNRFNKTLAFTENI